MSHVRLIILGTVLAFACGVCSAQRITEEQAADAARAFESDPNLEFWRIEVYEQNEGPSWSHFANYTLEAGTHDNPIADYRVYTSTGEVNGVTYHLRRQHPIKETAETCTKEQCEQTAEAFAAAKYQGFESMGFSLKTEQLDEGIWSFRWQQMLDYGAISMNYVQVEVRAADGRVSEYDVARYPVVRPQEPLISSEQAVRTAMHGAGITDMTEVAGSTLKVDPLGTTFWEIYIQGFNLEGFDVGYHVEVDVRTGDVLKAERTDVSDYESPMNQPVRNPPPLISPHQARDAVRSFEGNQDLVLICRELDWFAGDQVRDDEWYYDIEDRDNPDRSWDVDATTGEVTGFIDHAAYPDERPDEPPGSLTAAECREFAGRFVQAKFQGFDLMNFTPEEPEWAEHGWSFAWREEGRCDICSSSFVGVDVNSEDGRIQNYSADRVPEFTPHRPRITAEQAVELAKAAAGMVRLLEDPEPTLYAYPRATVWSFEVRGPDAQGRVHDAGAEVNAVSGEVVGIYYAMGASGSADPSEAGQTHVDVHAILSRIMI